MNEIKCLKCNKKVEELYLQSQYHIYLSSQNNFLTFLPRKNQKRITKLGNKSPCIKVNYCKNCHLIWFSV